MAKALAVRVRFPAWSASVRSRHLPICLCRNGNKTASVICAPSLRGLADIPVIQPRENARIRPGSVGSIPIGSVNFDGPLSLGYRKSSLEDERVRIPQHQATDEIQLASCPSHQCVGR